MERGPGLRSGRLCEPAAVDVVDCLADLRLGVHHERAVADDRLIDRLAGQDQYGRVAVGVQVDVTALAAEHQHFRFAGFLLAFDGQMAAERSEEHTSELQSLMRISYAVFCLKKKKTMKT